jgi:hypothetical protein
LGGKKSDDPRVCTGIQLKAQDYDIKKQYFRSPSPVESGIQPVDGFGGMKVAGGVEERAAIRKGNLSSAIRLSMGFIGSQFSMPQPHPRLLRAAFGIFAFTASLSGLHAETCAEAYERHSGKISYLIYDDILSQRTPDYFADDPDLKISWEHYEQSMAVKTDLAELKKILAGHPDPKVRTLAMMRLYNMEEPEALRAIYTRVDDDAETFPSRYFVTQRPDGSMELESEPYTAAKVASGMLGFAGFHLWLGDPAAGRAIEEWTGWYQYLYYRAAGRTSPIPKDRVPKIKAVRRKIDALPPVPRAWMLLAIGTIDLDNNKGRDPLVHIPLFATEEELIAAAKQLGPDALLAFLRDGTRGGLRDPQGDDPSLGRDFIFYHAGLLFREQDADALRSITR